MAKLENTGDGTAAPEVTNKVGSRDLVTRQDVHKDGAQARGKSEADTRRLVGQGTLPAVTIDSATTSGDRATPEHSDILPSADWRAIQAHAKGADKNIPLRFDATAKDLSTNGSVLTAEDRQNSVMWKIEHGLVDGSKVFKNLDELMKKDGPAAGTHNELARSEIRPDHAGPEAQHLAGMPPYRSSRLALQPDGSGRVDVQPGDSLWGIAKETLRHGQQPGYKPSNHDIDSAVRRIERENPQIHNPNRIKPHDQIKIPKDLIKEIPPEHPPEVGPHIEVENRGASPEFRDRIQREVDKLSPGVRRLLEANGSKIIVGERMSGVYPELAGVRPRGWPPGATWDNADGLYNAEEKTVVATEHRVELGSGQTVNNDRAQGVIRHEVGHAVDHALGGFSQTDEFKQAYDRDVALMTPEQKARRQYLLQDGNAGKSEAFAEVFGAINGSSGNPSETQDILRQFPSLVELLRRKQAALG